MKTDLFKGIASGDLVLLLASERLYFVRQKYFTPLSNEPYLVLDAEDRELKGEISGIASMNDVVKIDADLLAGLTSTTRLKSQ